MPSTSGLAARFGGRQDYTVDDIHASLDALEGGNARCPQQLPWYGGGANPTASTPLSAAPTINSQSPRLNPGEEPMQPAGMMLTMKPGALPVIEDEVEEDIDSESESSSVSPMRPSAMMMSMNAGALPVIGEDGLDEIVEDIDIESVSPMRPSAMTTMNSTNGHCAAAAGGGTCTAHLSAADIAAAGHTQPATAKSAPRPVNPMMEALKIGNVAFKKVGANAAEALQRTALFRGQGAAEVCEMPVGGSVMQLRQLTKTVDQEEYAGTLGTGANVWDSAWVMVKWMERVVKVQYCCVSLIAPLPGCSEQGCVCAYTVDLFCAVWGAATRRQESA